MRTKEFKWGNDQYWNAQRFDSLLSKWTAIERQREEMFCLPWSQHSSQKLRKESVFLETSCRIIYLEMRLKLLESLST